MKSSTHSKERQNMDTPCKTHHINMNKQASKNKQTKQIKQSKAKQSKITLALHRIHNAICCFRYVLLTWYVLWFEL